MINGLQMIIVGDLHHQTGSSPKGRGGGGGAVSDGNYMLKRTRHFLSNQPDQKHLTKSSWHNCVTSMCLITRRYWLGVLILKRYISKQLSFPDTGLIYVCICYTSPFVWWLTLGDFKTFMTAVIIRNLSGWPCLFKLLSLPLSVSLSLQFIIIVYVT